MCELKQAMPNACVGDTEGPKRYAIYARCNRAGTLSVETQIAKCRMEIQKRGGVVAEHHVFTDAGPYSRLAMSDRPGLSAMLEAARNDLRPFTFVVVDGTARISNWSKDVLGVYGVLSRCGITLVPIPIEE